MGRAVSYRPRAALCPASIRLDEAAYYCTVTGQDCGTSDRRSVRLPAYLPTCLPAEMEKDGKDSSFNITWNLLEM